MFTLKYPKKGQEALNAKIYKVVCVINSLFRIFLRLEVSLSVPRFIIFH